ncbi:TPA: hypothetical protein QCO08_002831 [Bacillus anthracis]|nr:hypothetical protein [Bacillus anthracis]
MSTKIIFIPGIKGSELYNGERKVWFPQIPKDMDELTPANQLEAKHILEVVNAFGVKKVEVYKGIADSFDAGILSVYPYDWRQDITSHINGLIKKIVDNARISSDNTVTLVAHSMGGMLAKLAILELQTRGLSDLVSRLVTIGTPWLGSTDAFKALIYGEPGVFEGKDLQSYFQFLNIKKTRELARKCPSVYQLLPNKEFFKKHENKVLLSSNSKLLTYQEGIDAAQEIFDSALENNHNVGRINILSKYIRSVHQAMLQKLPPHIQHECLIGSDIPTLGTLPIDTFKSKIYFKFESKFINGDGVVPLFSADPPHDGANKYYVCGEHHSLCSMEEVINFIKWIINNKKEELPNGIHYLPDNIYQTLGKQLKRAVIAKVKCPVATTILDEQGRYISGVFDSSIEEVSPLVNTENVRYYEIGNSKYMFMDKENEIGDLNFKIDSYDTGVVDISIQEYEDGIIKEITFDPLPVTKQSNISLNIPINNNIETSSVRMHNTIKKGQYKEIDQSEVYENTVIPSIDFEIKEVDGAKKAKRRKIFSGKVKLIVNNPDCFSQIFYSIDQQIPVAYTGQNHLDLKTGSYNVEFFGKDKYNRPTSISSEKFDIDKDEPFTKLNLEIEPESISATFEVVTQGVNSDTYYMIRNNQDNVLVDWTEVKENKINIPRSYLISASKNSLSISYYSKNEFNVKEEYKQVEFSLGNISMLMWSENTSYLTPAMVWQSLFGSNEATSPENFKVKLIKKKTFDSCFDDEIADDVKTIRFESELVNINVSFDENYSLYFNGPPTEILNVGEEYNFSFQLLTEENKERVTHTAPKVRLHPIKAGSLKDTKVHIFEKGGIFYGKFTVNKNFLKYKHKLIFTDSKNQKPPLREIPLIMQEQKTPLREVPLILQN